MKMLIPALFLLSAATAEAATPADTCADAGGATSVVSACLKKALESQEAKMKQALEAVSKNLKPQRQQELHKIQSLWRQYRDAKCRFLYTPEAGSGGLLDMQQCLLDETRRRVEELNGL